eukprot:1711699-Alexandrium_andersonii.AAC.1
MAKKTIALCLDIDGASVSVRAPALTNAKAAHSNDVLMQPSGGSAASGSSKDHDMGASVQKRQKTK